MSDLSSSRRCVECGEAQSLTHKNVSYPESGLDNVELFNVPAWVCANNHEEVEIPAVNELHELLAHMIIRKPASIVGPEIKFLRRRVKMTAKDFAARIGLTPVRLSQLENTRRGLQKRADLLIRLVAAVLIAARDSKPFPSDLAPMVEQFEQAWDLGTHRIKHYDNVSPDRVWQEAA
jgi:DNA-binding transcriptional regulator YiaG